MEEFEADRAQAIDRACKAGVERIIEAATDITSSSEALRLCRDYPVIKAAVGIHPQSVYGLEIKCLDRLNCLATDASVVAIGEIGLDYHYGLETRCSQIEIFKGQLSLASRLNLPVILHCRDAGEDMTTILKEWLETNPLPERHWKGVRHCFNQSLDVARDYIDMGFMLSFGAYIGYPSSKYMAGVIRHLPQDSILIETDSPFLPPQAYRGKRNEPSYITHTATVMAEIMDTTYDCVERATTRNAINLLNLDGGCFKQA
jgi:TatD DNase family protein